MNSRDLYSEENFKKLIKNGGLQKTSIDFTESVMQEISAEKTITALVYKPVISKFIINSLLALFGLLIISLLFMTDGSTGSTIMFQLPEIHLHFNFLQNFQILYSPLMAIIFASVLCLVLFDRYFRLQKLK